MKLSKKEFCLKFNLSEDQFFGRETIDTIIRFDDIEHLPKGCSLNSIHSINLRSLKTLPKNCSLKSKNHLNLSSISSLPKNYSIDAEKVWCKIIIPTSKDSSTFFFGDWSPKYHFEYYPHIKQNPSKFLQSSIPLEKSLAEFFINSSKDSSKNSKKIFLKIFGERYFLRFLRRIFRSLSLQKFFSPKGFFFF